MARDRVRSWVGGCGGAGFGGFVGLANSVEGHVAGDLEIVGVRGSRLGGGVDSGALAAREEAVLGVVGVVVIRGAAVVADQAYASSAAAASAVGIRGGAAAVIHGRSVGLRLPEFKKLLSDVSYKMLACGLCPVPSCRGRPEVEAQSRGRQWCAATTWVGHPPDATGD